MKRKSGNGTPAPMFMASFSSPSRLDEVSKKEVKKDEDQKQPEGRAEHYRSSGLIRDFETVEVLD